jgi:hypothetical protein
MNLTNRKVWKSKKRGITDLTQFIIMSAGSDGELLIWRALLCVACQIVDKLQNCEHSWNMNSFRKTSTIHM